jgi:hypothetical protein
MTATTANEKIIFGLKVKQLRQAQGLSFSELSRMSGMSLSYLNEIEKGKKFPKQDKVSNLAKALGTTSQELTDGELGRHLAPVTQLLQSNFLNELPLELFGIELSKVADMIAQAPTRVGAFISTLLELSRSYALREENFYFAALRSYLELHDNYFPELEKAVEDFATKHSLPSYRPVPPRALGRLLESHYGYTIVPDGLDKHPDLKMLRSVFQPDNKRLLLNGDLTPVQRGFQFGKELAFQHLKLVERANTSSLLRSRVFEKVLNHSKATYFSVALHIPLEPFKESVRAFMNRPTWSGDAFLEIMQRYNATPEMYYHRLTNVLPHFFGLREIFFLRFLHNPTGNDFTIDKELHLNRRHHPHENGLFEHYCRRWVSISALQEMPDEDTPQMRIDVQRSHYHGTNDEYLCITLARTGYPRPGRNVSVTLGFLVNDKMRETIAWHDDPAINTVEVNTTCERCPITDCQERAAEPIIVIKREKYQRIKAALKEL